MKYLVLTLLALVLISGCIEFEETQTSAFGYFEIVDNPDIYIKADTEPDEVTSGRRMNIVFQLVNKGETPLKDVTLHAYDQCLFVGENIKTFEEIKPEAQKTWSWKWDLPEIDFDRDCNIKFDVKYETDFTNTYGVTVLDELEYYAQEEMETLNEFTIIKTEQQTPLKIDIDFSKDHPFVAEEDLLMYITYRNTGSGYIDKIDGYPDYEFGKVEIDLPDNIEATCSGFTKNDEGNLFLSRDLRLFGDEEAKTTCELKTTAPGPINTGTITITATYKYKLDDFIIVKLKAR